jgi:hypothetical protein
MELDVNTTNRRKVCEKLTERFIVQHICGLSGDILPFFLFCFIFFTSDSAESLTALIHADDCHSFQISISKITF